MNQPIRLVIADDYPLFLEGLKGLLEKQEAVQLVGEARHGVELLQVVEQTAPDVVITDIQMPVMTGIEVARELGKMERRIGVIGLTMFEEEQLIVDMLEAGAQGYLLKSASKSELLEAVESVHAGHTYFCNGTSLRLSKMIASSKKAPFRYAEEEPFSEKELQIIRLICEQYASKEIADKTRLTHRTVEKYRDRIMDKTGARNVVGIVVYAIRKGIYKP